MIRQPGAEAVPTLRDAADSGTKMRIYFSAGIVENLMLAAAKTYKRFYTSLVTDNLLRDHSL